MSNYCTYSDVGILLQLTFSSTSSPTDSQVTELCAQITSEIDLTLRSIGISSQPTDATILSYLKMVASKGAACLVGMTYFGNASGVGGTQPTTYCDNYQAALKQMIDNPDIISGATIQGGTFENQVTAGYQTEAVTKEGWGLDGFKW